MPYFAYESISNYLEMQPLVELYLGKIPMHRSIH